MKNINSKSKTQEQLVINYILGINKSQVTELECH